MTDLPKARERMTAYLRQMEARMDADSAAWPHSPNRPKHHLVIAGEQEHDFGWVFFYNTREFVETGDHRHALAGNAPIIIDRHTGELHVTGTALGLDQYIARYRAGKSRPAK